MKRARALHLAIALIAAAGTAVPGATLPQRTGVGAYTRSLVRALAPPLIDRYADEGLWDDARLELDLARNPYYVRGDFDGDGSFDLAVYVLVVPEQVRAIAVLHGSVDVLRLFSERRDRSPGPYFPDDGRVEEVEIGYVGEHFRILGAGTRIAPFPCSELGNRQACDDEPFTLPHEAFEAVYLGKSSVLWVWRDDRYVLVTTSD